jgi:hypothetical protein
MKPEVITGARTFTVYLLDEDGDVVYDREIELNDGETLDMTLAIVDEETLTWALHREVRVRREGDQIIPVARK